MYVQKASWYNHLAVLIILIGFIFLIVGWSVLDDDSNLLTLVCWLFLSGYRSRSVQRTADLRPEGTGGLSARRRRYMRQEAAAWNGATALCSAPICYHSVSRLDSQYWLRLRLSSGDVSRDVSADMIERSAVLLF